MNTPHTAKPKSIRLTIPVSPEVHEAFQRIGAAASISTGRAMGEWLGDTLTAAEYLADTLEKARASPKLVAQQLHSYALGLTDETSQMLDRIREGNPKGRGGPARGAQTGPKDPLTPPSSNTGGKVPQDTKKAPKGSR